MDPYLAPYSGFFDHFRARLGELENRLTGGGMPLVDFASGHEHFGLHFKNGEWIFREWAPNAAAIFLVGTFSCWSRRNKFALEKTGNGQLEIRLPADAIKHGDLYRLSVDWEGGGGERIPAYARRCVQDYRTDIFNAEVWQPEKPYEWKLPEFRPGPEPLLIYEAHVGMAQDKFGIGTYAEFTRNIIPRIVKAGYTALQLMAIQEHPFYASFGYQVSNFFAPSSGFGTPDELKELIDTAHQAGLTVLLDLVHSHAVKNEVEGLSCFDGTTYQYFHEGPRGYHSLWDSRLFDYSKPEVLHFLLSNVRYWLDEFRFDGFRFDGVTSMLYYHHGLSRAFSSYDDYFGPELDLDSLLYLALANKVAHQIRPGIRTVAEEVSGIPMLCRPLEEGGAGFDYRLAMGIPDFWIATLKEKKDEEWHVSTIYHQMINRRWDEGTISYAESHDQALVGDKTIIFRLIDKEMYWHMRVEHDNLLVERGMALHKLIRLVTSALAGDGYLNFMGNEFGHPEWIDFPRPGNGWSHKYSRRQWSLTDNPELKYRFLAEFDRHMLKVIKDFNLFQHRDMPMLAEHVADQVLAFRRGPLVFVFNFNPFQSFTDYAISVPEGQYRLIMDSDRAEFGGRARLAPAQNLVTLPGSQGPVVRLYLPTRTALVLERTGDVPR